MKTFTFTRTMDAHQHVHVTIKDEIKFMELLKTHLEEEGDLYPYDLDSMDSDVVEVEYDDIWWEDEDTDDFFYVMKENNFPTSSEDSE